MTPLGRPVVPLEQRMTAIISSGFPLLDGRKFRELSFTKLEKAVCLLDFFSPKETTSFISLMSWETSRIRSSALSDEKIIRGFEMFKAWFSSPIKHN